MNHQPFLKPRLTGARFEGGAIPLEVLADLAVLAEMVVEVAKWKYREGNAARRRVPTGFANGVSLKLTGVGDGSAVANIGMFLAASTLPPGTQAYFEQARTAIVSAIGAAEQGKPITAHLPQKFLGYFDRFGRNLDDGEAIEFTEGQPAKVSLTRETRRRLLLASSADKFTEETAVYGLVHQFDQRALTFQLTLSSGAILSRIPVAAQHYDAVLEASTGFRDKVRVRVYGVGRFDRNNELQAIDQVEHVTTLDPLDIRVRLDELKLLRHGWHDGEGLAPDPTGLDRLADAFDMFYPDNVPLPYLFPTPEGRVLAEWSLKPWSPSLEIDLATRLGDWHTLNCDTDEEVTKELNLIQAVDWIWLLEQITNMGGEAE